MQNSTLSINLLLMKKILATLVILALIATGIIYFYKQSENSPKILRALPPVKTTASEVAAADAIPVKTIKVQKNQASYLNVSGTVKAEDQIKIFASTVGQITNVKVSEGQSVKKGQVLFEIGGLNNTKHTLYNQQEIAANSLNTAIDGYNKTIAGNKVAFDAANLQLQSAINQLQGAETDLTTMDSNLAFGDQNLGLLEDTYDLTLKKNRESLDQIDDLISSLESAQDQLNQQKDQLQKQLRDLNLDTTLDPATKDKMITDIKTAIAALDKNLTDTETQLQTAENTSDTTETVNRIADKQLEIQLNQSASALDALKLSKESAIEKLGLSGGVSDPVRMAAQSVWGTKVKNDVSLMQSKSQVDLARINLELIQSQIAGLTVKSPIDGVVGDLGVHTGDIASTQAPLTQIIGTGNYELNLAVDATTAQKITDSTQAEIQLADKFVRVPIKNISLLADPATKLITVTLALPDPNPGLKVNQNLAARLIIENRSLAANTFYIPLDAVIVGTEEQYVYVLEDGKAQKRVVQIGGIADENIEITQGLNENDQVIVENAKILIDNQPVNNATPIPR